MFLLAALQVCLCVPGVKAKTGSSAFLKGATQFPLILWHPYARHHYFCTTTEKEQRRWHAVLQDCIRHANDGELAARKVSHVTLLALTQLVLLVTLVLLVLLGSPGPDGTV